MCPTIIEPGLCAAKSASKMSGTAIRELPLRSLTNSCKCKTLRHSTSQQRPEWYRSVLPTSKLERRYRLTCGSRSPPLWIAPTYGRCERRHASAVARRRNRQPYRSGAHVQSDPKSHIIDNRKQLTFNHLICPRYALIWCRCRLVAILIRWSRNSPLNKTRAKRRDKARGVAIALNDVEPAHNCESQLWIICG